MVPVELDCFNVCSLGSHNTRAVGDEVATDCDLCSFGVFLLRANGANNLWKGDCSAFGNLVFVDEEDCVGSFDSVSNTLGQVAKFICCRPETIVSAVRVPDQISAFHLFSSNVVCHCQAMVLSESACFCFVGRESNCL